MNRVPQLSKSYIFLVVFVGFGLLLAWFKDREYRIIVSLPAAERMAMLQGSMRLITTNLSMMNGQMHMAGNMPMMQQATALTTTIPAADHPVTATAAISETPTITYQLKTNIGHEGMTFMGVGGTIDGQINPLLTAKLGDVVQVTLVDGDGAEHDISFPDFNATAKRVVGIGTSTTFIFKADKEGTFPYFCTVAGHRQVGMEGKIVVGNVAVPVTTIAPSVVRDPTDLPAPIGNRVPQNVRIDLKTVEVEGQLADGVTYPFWAFDGKIPGPFLRVRVGDTVELHLINDATSHMPHSIDLHAVTGPGGGAAVMQIPPGQEKSFTFKALNPGLYVYHCATPMVAEHISNGMYGLILVEPEGGLPAVDREFYIMQGEIYTQGKSGTQGHQATSIDKLLAETPEYFMFNGAAKALTKDEHALRAKVGDTVRIYFGVGGPNFTSSFHVIGEIFDRVYEQASLTAPPLTNVQTTMVPTGGATIVEFKLEVPGRYVLVDHSLSRMELGLVGFLYAEGTPNPTVFHEGPAQ